MLEDAAFADVFNPSPGDVIRLAPEVIERSHVTVIGEVNRATFTDEEVQEPYTIAPAISVPVLSKPGFELPSDHLRTLRAWLPDVAYIASVGWKARELEFREELSRIRGKPQIEVVTKTAKGTADTAARLREAGLTGPIKERPGGFRQWVSEDGLSNFLTSVDAVVAERKAAPGSPPAVDAEPELESDQRVSPPRVKPDVRLQVEVSEEFSNLTQVRVVASNVGAVFALDTIINVAAFTSGEHRWWSSPTFDLAPREKRTFEVAHLESGPDGQRHRKLTDGLGNDIAAVAFQDSDGGRYRGIRRGTNRLLEYVPSEAPAPDWSPW